MEHIEDDRQFTKGLWAGAIAGIIMFFYVELFHWVGLTKFGASYFAGDTVFTYKDSLGMGIIAFFIHTGVGVFWGVIISFLFSKVLNEKDYLLKTLFISFCIFFFHMGFLDEPFHYKREIHEQTLDLLIMLTGYLIYGLVLGLLLKKLRVIRS